MALIKAKDVALAYPAFLNTGRSLKLEVLKTLTLQRQATTMCRRLNGISLTIQDGERVGLYGPNGSGKTSLLRVLAGIFPPTTGSLESVGRKSSLLGLGAGVQPDLSAEENIRLLLRIDGHFPAKDKIDAIWNFTQLDESFRYQPMRSFSSGMQMRVLFATATFETSDILLLDEWLAVADASFGSRAEARMQQLVKDTSIVVIASHNLDFLKRLCTRLIYLKDGQIFDEEHYS